MIIQLGAIGLATLILWLMKLYVYGGWPGKSKMKSMDEMFPRRTKQEEKELTKRKRVLDERRAKRQAEKDREEENRPHKTFLDELDDHIAKRKAERNQSEELNQNRKSKKTNVTWLDSDCQS